MDFNDTIFNMFKSDLFKKTLVLLVAIGAINFLGDLFYFHWIYWWYDVVLHFISGICVAMAFLVVGMNYFGFSIDKKKKIILLSFGAVLLVGLLWEVFELKVGFTYLSDGMYYWRDTISDIFADVSGGFIGTLYSLKFFSKNDGKII